MREAVSALRTQTAIHFLSETRTALARLRNHRLSLPGDGAPSESPRLPKPSFCSAAIDAASYRACSRAFVRSGSIPVSTRTLSAARARILASSGGARRGGRTGRDLARVDGNGRLDAVDQLLEVADTRWFVGDHADVRLQANKDSLRKAFGSNNDSEMARAAPARLEGNPSAQSPPSPRRKGSGTEGARGASW